MTTPRLTRILAAACGALSSSIALAHDGHGLDGFSHWHSTDAWGFVVMGALGLAMWMGGRK